jgi:hypothetical protein
MRSDVEIAVMGAPNVGIDVDAVFQHPRIAAPI